MCWDQLCNAGIVIIFITLSPWVVKIARAKNIKLTSKVGVARGIIIHYYYYLLCREFESDPAA